MNFKKKYSKGTVAMAMLHGVLIGVAAVVVIGLLLTSTKARIADPKPLKEIPTSGVVGEENPSPTGQQSLNFFAKQHGAFSSSEAASTFINEDPALAKSAVIKVNDTFFVWTAVGLSAEEIEVSDYEGTYLKSFKVDASTCTAGGPGKLHEILAEKEISKIKMLATGKTEDADDKKTIQFRKNLTAITAFTEDMRIIRLHLLSHYSHTDECMKISF